jgi:uncharacterized protein involved in outer membrane biogenesis
MTTPPSKKSGCLKIFLYSLAGVILLFGLAVFVAPRFIPWDKIKTRSEEQLTKLLKHRVSIGRMGINIFQGLEINDLIIANARGFSKRPLLKTSRIIVQYRLWPLLFGKIMVRNIAVLEPEVSLEKSAGNNFNFSDMLPVAKESPQKLPEQSPVTGKKSPTEFNFPLELLVSEISLNKAKLIYDDPKLKQKIIIKDVNLSLKNITLAGLKPIELKLMALVQAFHLNLPLSLESSFRILLLEKKLVLDSLAFEIPGAGLKAQGEIQDLNSGPKLDLRGSCDIES